LALTLIHRKYISSLPAITSRHKAASRKENNQPQIFADRRRSKPIEPRINANARELKSRNSAVKFGFSSVLHLRRDLLNIRAAQWDMGRPFRWCRKFNSTKVANHRMHEITSLRLLHKNDYRLISKVTVLSQLPALVWGTPADHCLRNTDKFCRLCHLKSVSFLPGLSCLISPQILLPRRALFDGTPFQLRVASSPAPRRLHLQPGSACSWRCCPDRVVPVAACSTHGETAFSSN